MREPILLTCHYERMTEDERSLAITLPLAFALALALALPS
jgi:hypothetical protein